MTILEGEKTALLDGEKAIILEGEKRPYQKVRNGLIRR